MFINLYVYKFIYLYAYIFYTHIYSRYIHEYTHTYYRRVVYWWTNPLFFNLDFFFVSEKVSGGQGWKSSQVTHSPSLDSRQSGWLEWVLDGGFSLLPSWELTCNISPPPPTQGMFESMIFRTFPRSDMWSFCQGYLLNILCVWARDPRCFSSLKLTAFKRPWKWRVGRRSFSFWGMKEIRLTSWGW